MAEENNGENQNGGGNQEQNQQQPAVIVESDVAAPQDFLKGLVSDETLAKLSVNKKPENNQQNPAQQNPDNNNPNPAENKTPDENKEGKNEEGIVVKPEGEEAKSVFGLGKKGKQNSAPEITIENNDQLLGVIKSQFGQEYKNIKELPKFFDSVQKIRKEAQRVPDLEKEAKTWKTIVEALPEDLLESVQAFHSGKDYHQPILNRPKFDYSQPVDKQDIKALVNHYFPGKFTEEDFKDKTKAPALQIAETASIDKYNFEKQTRDNQRAIVQANAKKTLESQKQAVVSSVDYLKKNFPDMDEDGIKEVSSVLEGGPASVLSFFYNPDGTAKQEAAELFMWAKHGKSEALRLMGAAANIAETKTNEELLTRGNESPKPKNNPAPQTVSKEAQKKIAELQNIVQNRKKTF